VFDVEKTPLSSKKFVAFFFSLLLIAGVLGTALFTQTFGWPMVTFMCIGILGICTIAIGYVLSQAALDKFMRGVTGITSSEKLKKGPKE
jgi:hypothetical protein